MDSKQQKRVFKIVLTGGPCGGKTTGQSRLSTFFENLGWKVFRVPETATVLLSGGIKFSDLSADEAFKFQENLLKTMIQIENTFVELGNSCERSCLIICDRGAMDASAFISKEKWEQLTTSNKWNNVELRDNRYNHIVHMVSAAIGAEHFYSTEDHACRDESVELAKELDEKAAAAWVGHPYFDVIDNTTDFESKIKRMIACVCQKIGLDIGDRLLCNSRKLKFLVKGPLPSDDVFPQFQDFDVVHNYLQSNNRKNQARLRKRGQKGHWSYIHTIRKPQQYGQSIEVKTQLTHRDYINMLSQKDDSHFTIFKRRRCFIINNQYYQLDIYKEPAHPRCKGLMLLETYSAHEKSYLFGILPQFLNIEKEVTGNPNYSMFNLSLKEDWKTSKKFCRELMTTVVAEDTTPTDLPMLPNGQNANSQQSSPKKLTNGSSPEHNHNHQKKSEKTNGHHHTSEAMTNGTTYHTNCKHDKSPVSEAKANGTAHHTSPKRNVSPLSEAKANGTTHHTSSKCDVSEAKVNGATHHTNSKCNVSEAKVNGATHHTSSKCDVSPKKMVNGMHHNDRRPIDGKV